MIELYELAGADPEHRFSPFCWRARMALAHKGLEPVTVPWRFGEQDALPGAPETTTVPVIVDDGHVVQDSTAIARYLEHRYDDGPSLFGGPVGEAHARFVIGWTDAVLQPAVFRVVVGDVFRFVPPDQQPAWRQKREQRLGMTIEEAGARRVEALPAFRAVLPPLRWALRETAYLGGEEPSYADYAVFGAFQFARLTSDVALLEHDDMLHGWRERLLDLFGGLARRAARP